MPSWSWFVTTQLGLYLRLFLGSIGLNLIRPISMGICIEFQSWLFPAHQGPIRLVFAMDFRSGWSWPVRICFNSYLPWSSGSVCHDTSRFDLVGICLSLQALLILSCYDLFWWVFALVFELSWSWHLGAYFDGFEHSTNDLTLLDADLA